MCLLFKISLKAELTWFSFTQRLLISMGKGFNYFGGGYNHPHRRIFYVKISFLPTKKPIFYFFFVKLNKKVECRPTPPPTPLSLKCLKYKVLIVDDFYKWAFKFIHYLFRSFAIKKIKRNKFS